MLKIVVIIPVKNEKEGIGQVINELRRGEANPLLSNIVVLDGNSDDGTREIVNDLSVDVFNASGRGKGADFRLFLEAGKRHSIDDADIYMMMDGDGTYDPKDLGAMLKPIVDDVADVVMGSRLKGQIDENALKRRLYVGNVFLTSIARLLYWRRDLTDLCTGSWAFKKEALKNIKITADGFDLEANLYAQFVKRNYRIKHVPIHYRQRINFKDSKLKWYRDGRKILVRLIREKFDN